MRNFQIKYTLSTEDTMNSLLITSGFNEIQHKKYNLTA